MATDRPETSDAASFRTAAQRRMPVGNFLGSREEWAKPRGRKLNAGSG